MLLKRRILFFGLTDADMRETENVNLVIVWESQEVMQLPGLTHSQRILKRFRDLRDLHRVA